MSQHPASYTRGTLRKPVPQRMPKPTDTSQMLPADLRRTDQAVALAKWLAISAAAAATVYLLACLAQGAV